MKFRTEITPTPLHNKISLHSPILLAGSCFAEHIGEKLERYRFSVYSNPFGVIFNPVSLAQNLVQCLKGELPNNALFLNSQELWRHYQLHSTFAYLDLEALKQQITISWEATQQFLQRTDFLVLTWGTAWVYRLKETQQLVANCHKVPAKMFQKSLLSVTEITESVTELLSLLPLGTKVILTVSPVRHVKDTLELNSVSKATLRLACHQLQEQYERIHYFPSFELLNDDLRDYRFYSNDLLHPSTQAVQYVWDKFVESCIATEAQQFIKKFEKLLLRVEHRPRVAQTETHQQFLEKTVEELRIINEVDVSDLVSLIEKKILQSSKLS